MKILVCLFLIFVVSIKIALVRSERDKASDEAMMYPSFFLLPTLAVYFLVGICVQVLNWTNVLSTNFSWTEHLVIAAVVTSISMTVVWFWMGKELRRPS